MKAAIFTGPTGGHFFPALAFCEALKNLKPDTQILLVTSLRAYDLVEKAKERVEADFEYLSDFPLPRANRADFLIRIVPFLINLGQSFSKTKQILNQFKPDITVGFGSYISFPGLWISRQINIPTLVHEQNWKMGKANRRLARKATRVALSFDPGKDSLPQKFQVTGLPLRESLVRSAQEKKRREPAVFPDHQFRILIVGGSQGAHSLNQLWMGALERFSHEEKSKLAVIHITGRMDFESVKTMYLSKQINALVIPFHEHMEEVYPEADLAVTRAGAGTLFELAAFGLPAVVVPYPHAEAHQEHNARYFKKAGAIRVIHQNDSPSLLKDAVSELMNSKDLRDHMSQSLRRLSVSDAGSRLAKLCAEMTISKEACTA